MRKKEFFVVVLLLISPSKSDTEIGEDLIEKLTEFRNVEQDLKFIAQELSPCRVHVILIEVDVFVGRILVPYVLTVPAVAFANTCQIADWTKLVQESEMQLFRRSACLTTLVITMSRVFPDSYDPRQCCMALQLLSLRQNGRTLATVNNAVLFGDYDNLDQYMSLSFAYLCQPALHGNLVVHQIIYLNDEHCRGLQWCPAMILLYCPHCDALTHQPVPCLHPLMTVLCLKDSMQLYKRLIENGRSIMWRWESRLAAPYMAYANDFGQFKPAPIRYRQPTDACLGSNSERLHHFLIQPLNVSVQQMTLDNYYTDIEFMRLFPTFAWTEENPLNSLGEFGSVDHASYVAIFPTETMCSGKAHLRFITKSVAKIHANIYVGLYTDPFDVYTWLATILVAGLVTGAIAFVATKLDSLNYTAYLHQGGLMVWSLFMDQVDSSNVPTQKFSRRITVTLVPFLLCLTFVLSNLYKGVLNANYVTTKDDRSQMELLKEIENFTVFLPVSRSFWNTLSRNLKKDPEWPIMLQLTRRCFSAGVLDSEVDTAICDLYSRAIALRDLLWKRPSCLELLNDLLQSRYLFNMSIRSYGCDRREVLLTASLLQNMQLFPLGQLEAIIKENLTQQNTALVASHAFVISLWPIFKTVTETNEDSEFVHNLHIEQDDSFAKKAHQLIIRSSLDPSYTSLVTHCAGVLLSSGIWNLWTGLQQTNLAEEVDDEPGGFRPLSLDHDAIYLLLWIVTCLLGLTVVVLFAQVIVTNLNTLKLWLVQAQRFVKARKWAQKRSKE